MESALYTGDSTSAAHSSPAHRYCTMSSARSCSRRLRAAFWCLFPHACLVCSLVVYSVIGAFVFVLLEGADSNRTSKLTQLLDTLWDVSKNSCVINDAEGFKYVSGRLIVQYMKDEKVDDDDARWDFLSSLFFCCTVFTTVGYGNLFPVTVSGKVACMVYAAIGVPLMLLVLADLGDILAGCMSDMYNRVRESCYRCPERKSKVSSLRGRSEKSSMDSALDSRVSVKEPLNLVDVLKSQATVQRKYLQMRNIDIFEQIIIRERILPIKGPYKKCYSCPELDKMPSTQSAFSNFDKLGEELDKLDVPVLVIVFVVVAYIMLGALILPWWEAWNTLDAFYFCFVTLTTIGFGDVVPEHPNYFLLLSLYTVVGMAIMCMAFKLMQNRMVCLYKQCIVCISGGNVTMAPAQ